MCENKIFERRKGYAALRMLLGACAVMVLLLSFSVVFEKLADGRNTVENETQYVYNWLTNKMRLANIDESDFTFYVFLSSPSKIGIYWKNGPKAKTWEYYTTDKVKITSSGSATSHAYDGVWHTLSPALTLKIAPVSGSAASGVLSVSAEGYAETK